MTARTALAEIGAGLALLLALTASGCQLPSVHSYAETRWTGSLTATDAAHCPPTRGSLVTRDAEVSFAPDDGVWVLTGTLVDGHIKAEQSRMTRQGNRTFQTTLVAKVQANTITGTYQTPLCTYNVDLRPF